MSFKNIMTQKTKGWKELNQQITWKPVQALQYIRHRGPSETEFMAFKTLNPATQSLI